MTQLEHVVLDYIERHPHCSSADILSSFASQPEATTIHSVIESLAAQKLINRADGGELRKLTAHVPAILDA